MLSLVSSRAALRVAPRAFAAAGASRSMAVGGKFGMKVGEINLPAKVQLSLDNSHDQT